MTIALQKSLGIGMKVYCFVKEVRDQKLTEYILEGESRRGCGRFCNPVPELLVHAALLCGLFHTRGENTRCLQADIFCLTCLCILQ